MSDRPFGVIVLAVFQLLGSLGALFFGWLVLTELALSETESSFTISAFGIIILILAVIGLLLSYGLFMLKPWAWLGATILQWLSVLSSLINVSIQSENRGGALGVFNC